MRSVVRQIPVPQLWDDRGVLPLRRGRSLGEADIADLLRARGCQFVIADVGHPLDWVPSGQLFDCWKREVKPRLVPADAHAIPYDEYPGEYCYVASEWRGDGEWVVVLLEKYH